MTAGEPAAPAVYWRGVIAPVNSPFLSAEGLPMMLRHDGPGAELRAGAACYPVPVRTADGADVGELTAAWVERPAGAGLGLHVTGTATGPLADLLSVGARISVYPDVSGPVSLVRHGDVMSVIELDAWSLRTVTVTTEPAPAPGRIWSTEPGREAR